MSTDSETKDLYAENTRLYNPSESEDNELEIFQSAVLFRAVVELEGPESSRCPSEGTVSGSGRSVTRQEVSCCIVKAWYVLCTKLDIISKRSHHEACHQFHKIRVLRCITINDVNNRNVVRMQHNR